MKYLPLIWAGLWRKRMRTSLTLCSVMVAFILMGVLAGVDAAFVHAVAVARLDRLLVTAQPANMPISYAQQIERVPGVSLVVPRTGVFGYYQNAKQRLGALATDERFFAFRPELTITKEQLKALRQERTGAVVSTVLADKYGWKIGDKIPLHATNATQTNGSPIWTFEIVGLIGDRDFPESQWFIGNYQYVDQGRASGKGTVDAFLVRIDDPAQASHISSLIDRLFVNSPTPTRTSSERAMMQSNVQFLGDAKFLTHAVVGAVLFMLLFVTGATMTQSIRERIPEFAMLKTVGFSDVSVLSFVIAESVVLCVFAAVVGLLLSKLLISMVHTPPYSFLLFQTSWIATLSALGSALIIALASALFPAWRVQRLSITDALVAH